MDENEFQEIEDSINEDGWYHFGKKKFECSGLDKQLINYYLTNKKLPKPCNECYKALIFLEDNFSKENINNLLRMLRAFKSEYRGKLDHGVAVFYFRKKAEMLEFLDLLEKGMPSFNVAGKLQWRRACKEFQNLQPGLWKNTKIFISDIE